VNMPRRVNMMMSDRARWPQFSGGARRLNFRVSR
jgi:hypothetical protein